MKRLHNTHKASWSKCIFCEEALC